MIKNIRHTKQYLKSSNSIKSLKQKLRYYPKNVLYLDHTENDNQESIPPKLKDNIDHNFDDPP